MCDVKMTQCMSDVFYDMCSNHMMYVMTNMYGWYDVYDVYGDISRDGMMYVVMYAEMV